MTLTNVETITGGSAADVIVVTSSGVVVDGSGGNDRLTTANGADTVTGGAGSDLFTFTATSQSAASSGDTITDFVPGTDKLVFQGLLSGTFSYVGAHTNAFAGGGNSSARFNDSSKVLQVDTNGDGSADMEVTLTGNSASGLSASNFQWS